MEGQSYYVGFRVVLKANNMFAHGERKRWLSKAQPSDQCSQEPRRFNHPHKAWLRRLALNPVAQLDWLGV